MVVFLFLSVFMTLLIIWWLLACYLGMKSATLITIVIAALFLWVISLWLLNNPSEQEIKLYETQRKGVTG